MIQKISDMINNLQEIMKIYGDLPLVSSSDDEGNSYNYIHYDPTPGSFDKNNREFSDQIDEYAERVVCVN